MIFYVLNSKRYNLKECKTMFEGVKFTIVEPQDWFCRVLECPIIALKPPIYVMYICQCRGRLYLNNMISFPLTMNKAANATVATIQISLDSSKSKHSPWTQTWVLAGHGNVRLQIGFCDSTMILPLPPVPEGPALCVQMDFTRTFEANAKCSNINQVWSHFYKIFVVLKYHRRPWANIFDTDICRSINIPKKAIYTTLM